MNDSLETQFTTETAVAPLPVEGGALTLSIGAGLLNVSVGLMIVAAFLLFFGGGIAYLSRLALVGREQGLTYMMHGVRILFVLAITLGVVQYIQRHPNTVIWIVALVVVMAGAYAALQAAKAPEEEEHR